MERYSSWGEGEDFYREYEKSTEDFIEEHDISPIRWLENI